MADEYSQRSYGRRDHQQPYRGSERAVAEVAPPRRGSDPLAELARLIGEKDPFADPNREVEEFRRASAPQGAGQAPSYRSESTRQPHRDRPFGDSGRYGGTGQRAATRTISNDVYGREQLADFREQEYRGKLPPLVDGAQINPNPDLHHFDDQDLYEYDEQPRRRMGALVIASVLGLAILGTAAAFAYRGVFGSNNVPSQPQVIKADPNPIKVVPASANGASPNADPRVDERAAARRPAEKIVSREEQPIKERTSAVTERAPSNDRVTSTAGSGVVVAEPKRVRTIAILPDGIVAGSAAPDESTMSAELPELAPEPPPVSVVTPGSAPASVPHDVPQPRHRVTQAGPPRLSAPPSSSSAPLSLSPARVASAGPAPALSVANANAAASGYGVQVSSQRSEADAQAAFRGLQAKYPSELGNKPFFIHKVDLGAKGVYYRAVVGPFANAGPANELCESLKSGGAQCIVRKN